MNEEKEKLNLKRLLSTSGLILFTACLVGGGVWYYMNKIEKAQKNSYDDSVAVMQKEINELKTNSIQESSSTIMKVPEIGIQFTLPNSLSDAYYVTTKEGGLTQAGFTTKTLVAKGGSDCAGGFEKPVWAPIGAVSLSTNPPSNNEGDFYTTESLVKQIDGKYLYYKGPQSACSATLSQEAANTQNGAMLRTALEETATTIQ